GDRDMSNQPWFLRWPSVPAALAVMFLALTILFLPCAEPALAVVTISAPTSFAVADQSDGAADGVFTVNTDLRIAPGGSILCNDPADPAGASACNIAIVVHGNMEIHEGGAILAENTVGGGSGGNITITVTGSLLLHGPSGASAGARISSSDTTAGGTGNAGNIAITVGNFVASPPTGDFTMQPGSEILANSANRSAGAITIAVARSADVDGLVESFGGMGGVGGNQPPAGGPIFIDA